MIDPSSISTQVAERDEDLRGSAYFDVKMFPAMTYKGHRMRRISGNSWRMDGSLTIHGVTKVVPLVHLQRGVSDVPPGSRRAWPFMGRPDQRAISPWGRAIREKSARIGIGCRNRNRCGSGPECQRTKNRTASISRRISTMNKFSAVAAASLLAFLLLGNQTRAQGASAKESNTASATTAAAPQTNWTIDKIHSRIGFSVAHFVITQVTGYVRISMHKLRVLAQAMTSPEGRSTSPRKLPPYSPTTSRETAICDRAHSSTLRSTRR